MQSSIRVPIASPEVIWDNAYLIGRLIIYNMSIKNNIIDIGVRTIWK
jgi:hypothetical protein